MSWNRTRYDQCAYQKELSQSTSSFQYTMDPNKFYNCKECRPELGVVGGNNVSLTQGNMVDLESDLMGITRQNSLCPERKYIPHCHQCSELTGIPCDGKCEKADAVNHRQGCQFINYAPRVDHVGYHLEYPKCAGSKENKYPPQFNPLKY